MPINRTALKTAAALIIILTLALSGCQRRAHELEAPNTITVSSIADAKNLLPPLASDSASGDISGLVFNGLVKYGPDLKLTGDLADNWEIKDDGLTILFYLKKNVAWQDGEPFTADDVVFTYKTVTDPNVPTPYGENYGPVENVEAVDNHTVKVTYTEPYAPALESWSMGIMPEHLLKGKDITDEKYNRHPMGTGPYKLEKWDSGQKIVLRANENYFEGRPNIDRYIMRIIPDTATTFLELKSFGVDFMGLTPNQYRTQTETDFFDKYFQKFRYPAFSFTYMGYNLKDPRFADRRVRRALTHAIKKQDIIEGVLLGYGTPCTGPYPPESWVYNPDVPEPAYDPERALELLKEAGWEKGESGLLEKDGEPFRFTVITNQGNERRLKTAQIIKEHLKKIGVEIEIQVLEWQAFLNEYVHKRRFEALIMGWALSRDPDLYDIWHSSKTGEGEFNFISYENPELDKLLLEGRRTFDLEKRREIYHRAQEILAKDQPYTFLYVPDALPILHARFKGVEEAPIGIWYDFINWRVPKDSAEWYPTE